MVRSLLIMNDLEVRHVRSDNRYLRSRKSRYWMGTIWEEIDKNIINELECKYKMISDDDHTEDGQLHWHCLLEFENPRQWPPSTTTHWEIPRNVVAARAYCVEKGPNFIEEGSLQVRCQNGNEWRGFVEECKIRNPKEMIDGPYSQMYARYRGFAGEVHNQFAKLEILNGDLQNLWLCGEAGSGKTKYVWDNFPDLYVKPINKWWNGYHGQENVLIDDWDPSKNMLIYYLKIWADRYPFPAEIKGSSMMARPKRIIVTSNYTIEQCCPNPEDIPALRRRFKVIKFWRLGNEFRHGDELN